MKRLSSTTERSTNSTFVDQSSSFALHALHLVLGFAALRLCSLYQAFGSKWLFVLSNHVDKKGEGTRPLVLMVIFLLAVIMFRVVICYTLGPLEQGPPLEPVSDNADE